MPKNPLLEIAEAFNLLIQQIVDERAPYMAEATFVKHSFAGKLSYIKVGGIPHIIYDRNSLFIPSQLNEGDIVQVDTRYIVNQN